tara:strand:- start:560 stop:685 length:126 start_codon:yes stop_codon:yes gene_type:complete
MPVIAAMSMFVMIVVPFKAILHRGIELAVGGAGLHWEAENF